METTTQAEALEAAAAAVSPKRGALVATEPPARATRSLEVAEVLEAAAAQALVATVAQALVAAAGSLAAAAQALEAAAAAVSPKLPRQE